MWKKVHIKIEFQRLNFHKLQKNVAIEFKNVTIGLKNAIRGLPNLVLVNFFFFFFFLQENDAIGL